MLTKLKPKSEFSKNVLTLMTGTAIAQAIPIAISPILTRLYTPEDFGKLALFISIVSVMGVFATGKYELAIILPKKNSTAYQLVSLSFILSFLISVFYIVPLVGSSIVYSFDTIYYLLPIASFFIALNSIFDRYNNRVKNYKLMSYQRLIKTTIESITSIAFITLFSIQTGLVWGFIFGYFISSWTMLYINFTSFKELKFKPSLSKMKVLSRRYINFPKYSMPHTFLNTLSANIPIFLIPLYYGSHTLGLYAFGLKIVKAPLELLLAAMFNVLGQKMAEEYAKGNEIKSLFISIVKKLITFAIFMIPLFIYIDDIFVFIFGQEWRVAGEYIQILSPCILVEFIVSPFATIPHIYNVQRKAFVLEIIYSLVRISPFLIGAGYFDFTIQQVLMVYMISATLLLFYGYNWYYNLVKGKRQK